MKKYQCLLFIVLLITPLSTFGQQSINGDWEGYVDVMGNRLNITTHFVNNDTAYSGTLDIPQQGAEGLTLQNIQVTRQDSVFFRFFAGTAYAHFEGKMEEKSIKGSFIQNGQSFPFLLNKSKPKAALPYNHEELLIKNGDITVAGTLTTPEGKTALTCVILLSGSGAQDRNSNVLGFKIFEQVADHLTRQGIATFRFDDRGVGMSTGNFAETTLSDMSSDVNAIIAHLSQREELNTASIIILGHSQGGVIAGSVAAESKYVDGLILMASTAVPLKEVIRLQVRQAYRGKGIPDEKIEAEILARENLMMALKNKSGVDEAQKNYIGTYKSLLSHLPEEERKQLGNLDAFTSNQTDQLELAFGSPQMLSLLFHDPARDFQKVNIPTLVIFGGKDTQVTVDQNREALQKALEKAGSDYKIEIFQEANHLFQKAGSGAVSEYGKLKPEFIDGFLMTIEKWVKNQYN